MIIVRFQGGLGNQLFQFALYENYRQRGINVKADVSNYLCGREKRRFELNNLGINLEVASKTELRAYYADNDILYDRVARHLWGNKKYIKEKDDIFKPDILQLQDGYLNGYWQSEKYFSDIEKIIRSRIHFSGINTKEIQSKIERMKGEESVSIHIRFGDYLYNKNIYGNICTRDYYSKAISYIMKNTSNPIFYFFSDEVQKIDLPTKLINYHLVTDNHGKDSYKDMYMMSQCKHHIIANSTFSWWGAWLSETEDKIVITPSKWNQLCKAKEICANNWLIM